MSRRVEKLAREMAALVRDADTDVYAHEVRSYFEGLGWSTEQVYSAGRTAETRGWIARRGKLHRRLRWGAPRVTDQP